MRNWHYQHSGNETQTRNWRELVQSSCPRSCCLKICKTPSIVQLVYYIHSKASSLMTCYNKQGMIQNNKTTIASQTERCVCSSLHTIWSSPSISDLLRIEWLSFSCIAFSFPFAINLMHVLPWYTLGRYWNYKS